MQREAPEGPSLLATARDALLQEILPKLSGTDAFIARMIANAMAIARYLERHPGVERVLYPGLVSHPGHAIAARQMRDGFGGMMSFLVKGGFDDAQRFCTRLKVIVPATSLGGVESLAEHRKTVEGPSSPVPDNLVRISVGIEHVDDLIADLEQALAGS